MKIPILSTNAAQKGEIELPSQFKEPVREDLILRAVIALRANIRQAYGSNPEAGKNVSAMLSKRRRKYRGTYGIGQSRTPRKVMSRSGTRFNYTGAFAPQTVGGRRAHPPKAEKIWSQKVNKLENRKAIRSALSATVSKDIVASRGHKVPANYPFAITDDFQSTKKTKDVKEILAKLGLKDELDRTSQRKIRAGKGKTRGRKYKTKTGLLIVTSEEGAISKSAKNIPGVHITTVEKLNTESLAPGAVPGRITLFTESAIKKISESKIFTSAFKAETTKEEKPKKETKKKIVKKVVKKVAKEAEQ
ncbi:50S ribosomal protein L4 [Candidatus Woesearchaeota archaeon]|nr:50S ribosomal protein L4 [Candidatus Woesearchaeota archaeon]MCF8013337.1 50S ribosomal protein L4 [Candidatus Woesearchaeota archaeon]